MKKQSRKKAVERVSANSTAAQPATVSVTLNLDHEQLGILLGMFESSFHETHGQPRSLPRLVTEIEAAANRWSASKDNAFAFEIVRMAPVYRQLFDKWAAAGGDPDGGHYTAVTDNVDEFAAALREARRAVAGRGGHKEKEVQNA